MKKKRWEKGLTVMLLLSGCFFLTGCQGEAETLVTTGETGITEKNTSSEKITQSTAKPEEEEKEIDWIEENFTGERIFISYPVFSFHESGCFEQVNQQVKEDALRILEYFDVDMTNDTLDITYEIADITKDWISIVYCGSYSRTDAAYPTEVCYTSNLSLKDGTHLRVSQMEKPEELAEQIIKKEYRLIGEEAEQIEAVKNYISAFNKEDLSNYLANADFGTESYESYPDWFSFWCTVGEETQISVVIPVPHVLGDYAVLEFFSEEAAEKETK